MKRTFQILLVCIIAAAIPLGALGLSHLAYADGQDAAPTLVDAGPPAATPQPVAAMPAPEATAPATSPAIDPAGDPLGTGSLVYRLWKQGALFPAILVAIFGMVVLASRYISWLTEGRRAVYTAAAIAGLAMLAEPASRGETPNVGMFIAALGAMTALLFPPTKPKAG